MVNSEIHTLAQSLGVTPKNPSKGIIKHCLNLVRGWVKVHGGVKSVQELERVISQQTGMAFEEIHSDEDFQRLTQQYTQPPKNLIFATLSHLFDPNTFGALIQLQNPSQTDPIKVVAVIDARGQKANRKFFTKWHEIAHRLTTHSNLPEVVFRSSNSPIEQLMDEIASHIGFFPALMKKAIRKAGGYVRPLDFQMVEEIQKSFPTASFQSTLIAATRMTPFPTLYIEVKEADGYQRITRNLPNKLARHNLGFRWVFEPNAVSRFLKELSLFEMKRLQQYSGGPVFHGIKVPDRAYGIATLGENP